jgi:hypothetical protein
MADKLETMSQTLRESNIALNQLQATVTSLQQELMSQKSRGLKEEELTRMKLGEYEKKLSEVDRWSNVVRDLEDIPGVRTPRWYEVDVTFARGDTTLSFNSAEISPDGPFVITQMMPYYTYTEDTTTAAFEKITSQKAVAGRTVPCSAYPFLLSSLGNTTGQAAIYTGALIGDLCDPTAGGGGGAAAPAPLSAIPEFSFQIEIAGSGRFWTNRAIPAASFYGEFNPLYAGIAGWVERTDRIVLHCTPETAVPIGGRVRMVFHGYQILGHVNIGQALGY